MACPTSPGNDQTKGGGRPGVQRTPGFGARERRVRSDEDEDTALIQIESKIHSRFEVHVELLTSWGLLIA